MSIVDGMQQMRIDPPVTHENVVSVIASLPAFGTMAHAADSALGEFLSPTSHAEFCISGIAYAVRPMLVNPTARESLLYMQSLSVLAMDGRYYTHRHGGDSHLFLYTLSGEGELTYGGKCFALRAGDGAWIDCSHDHEYRTVGAGWTHVALHVGGVGIPAFHDAFAAGHAPVFHQELGGAFSRGLERLVRDYSTLSFGREALVSDDISGLAATLIRGTGQDDALQGGILIDLQLVIDYLEQHLSEPITLDALAELAHVSKYHLAHEFKRLTGYSPIDYLINLRINQARVLLQTSQLPVYRVAEAVGIPNEQYFGKLFKRRCGIAPGQYRRALHGG